MIEALMKDEEGTELRFLKGNECLVHASVARAWYAIPVIRYVEFFEMDSISASCR